MADSAKPINEGESDRSKPIDITTRLRQTRANMLGTEDEQHYWDCHEAAAEIDRLRSIVRLQDAAIRSGDTLALTEAEREAIHFMLRHAAHAADEPAFPDSADYRLHNDALSGLLERTT